MLNKAMQSTWRFAKKKWKFMCVFASIILLFSAIELSISVATNKMNNTSLNRIAQVFTIFASATAILSCIVAICMFWWYIYDFKTKRTVEKAEKEIEIAKEFCYEILPAIDVIYAALHSNNIDLYNWIENKVGLQNAQDFDSEEAQIIFSKDDLDSYDNMKKKISNLTIKADIIRNLGVKGMTESVNVLSLIITILNRLEHVGMRLNSGISSDEIIYQSLHQAFLKFIKVSYLEISTINNQDASEKYYTNIITWYKKWAKKEQERKEEYLSMLKQAKANATQNPRELTQ